MSHAIKGDIAKTGQTKIRHSCCVLELGPHLDHAVFGLYLSAPIWGANRTQKCSRILVCCSILFCLPGLPDPSGLQARSHTQSNILGFLKGFFALS